LSLKERRAKGTLKAKQAKDPVLRKERGVKAQENKQQKKRKKLRRN